MNHSLTNSIEQLRAAVIAEAPSEIKQTTRLCEFDRFSLLRPDKRQLIAVEHLKLALGAECDWARTYAQTNGGAPTRMRQSQPRPQRGTQRVDSVSPWAPRRQLRSSGLSPIFGTRRGRIVGCDRNGSQTIERMRTLQIAESAATAESNYPNAYTAIPPNGKTCPHTGLAHSHLYQLLSEAGLARPYVRTLSLRQPGSHKGKSLFHVGDFLAFLDALASQQGSGVRRGEMPAANIAAAVVGNSGGKS